MKKLMYAIGLGLIASSVYAATIGCMSYDDTGCSINGNIVNGNGIAMPSKTATQVATSTPTAVGQVVFCSNCAAAGGAGTVCVSTATTGGISGSGSYFVLSTGTVCK